MQIFSKSPDAKIKALRASVETLDRQIAEANALVSEKNAAAISLARKGADAAARRGAVLEGERAKADVQIQTEARAEAACELEQAERRAADDASIKIHADDADAKLKAMAVFNEDAAAVVAALSKVAGSTRAVCFVPEAVPLAELFEQLATQTLPASIPVIDEIARKHCRPSA
jgi:hypothetical protein